MVDTKYLVRSPFELLLNASKHVYAFKCIFWYFLADVLDLLIQDQQSDEDTEPKLEAFNLGPY